MHKTVYELSYHSCACPKVLSGQISNPEQSECSRQSILYVLSQLEPNSSFQVEILESVLRGNEHCKFRITKKIQDNEAEYRGIVILDEVCQGLCLRRH